MEKLTGEQIANMSKQEIAARFNLLIAANARAADEVRTMGNLNDMDFFQGKGTPSEKEEYNKKIRALDRLTRPFAATNYCDDGVKALPIHLEPESDVDLRMRFPNITGTKAQTLSWIMRIFLVSICEGYIKGAPRRVEAEEITRSTFDNALIDNQISAQERLELDDEIVRWLDVEPAKRT